MTRKNVPSPSAFGFVATNRHVGIYRPIDHQSRKIFAQIERDSVGRWNVYTATQTAVSLHVDLLDTWPTLGQALAAAKILDDELKTI